MKKVLIFNAPPKCVDKDTEFLTPSGWKKISLFSKNDEALVFNKDTRRSYFEKVSFVKNNFKDNFINISQGQCDMVLSPEHTVLYETETGYLRTITAEKLSEKIIKNNHGFGGKVYSTFSLDLPEYPIEDCWLKFIVMLSAEASWVENRNEYKISLKKEYKKKNLRKLLTECNMNIEEQVFKSMPGFSRWFIDSPYKKGLPDFFYLLSSRQKLIIKNELLLWDGSIKCSTFRTTLKNEADIAQFVFASCGMQSTILKDDRVGEIYLNGKYTRKSICYSVKAQARPSFCLDSREIKALKEKNIDGFSYCLTTSTGFWVARRSDKIFITGNSGKDYSTDYICAHKEECFHKEFKTPLIGIVCKSLNIDVSDFRKVYDQEKDIAERICIQYAIGEKRETKYYSIRQYLIHMSENVMKPLFGNDFFGDYAGKNLNHGWNIFSDGGFIDEVKALYKYTDKKNITVVKIIKDGHSFVEDSRGYIPDELVGKTHYLENDGSDEWLLKLDYFMQNNME